MAWIHASIPQSGTETRCRWRRRYTALALILVVPLTLSCGTAGQRHAQAQAKLEEARRLFAANRAGDAIKAADDAQAADPKWPDPHKFKAEVLTHSSHFRQAYDELLAAYRLNPDDLQAAIAVLSAPGYPPAADQEPIARKAVAEAPDNSMTHFYLALALEAGGPAHYTEAMTSLKQARQLAPDAIQPMIETGKLSSMQGDQTTAVELLQKAISGLGDEMQHGHVSPDKLEDWLQLQRSAFFWMSQAYRRKGDARTADKAAAVAARLSATTAMLRTLKDRAAARPDDLDTQRKLKSLLETGRLG